jgi:hypothetical protein
MHLLSVVAREPKAILAEPVAVINHIDVMR